MTDRDYRQHVEQFTTNPLDTTFGEHSRRGQHLKSHLHAGYLEITKSVFQTYQLSTVAKLAATAEKNPDALKYFPQGSLLRLTASGDSGDWTSEGYRSLSAELIFNSDDGKPTSSGQEQIFISRGGPYDTVVNALNEFLRSLQCSDLAS